MKKRLLIVLAVLLAALPLAGLRPLSVQAAGYAFAGGGDGTPGNPYIVRTAEDLDHVRDDLTASYKLRADIDLSAYGNWTPIGDPDIFSGTFDGDGYRITGMTIRSSADSIGLFGYVDGASVKIENVRLEQVNIESTSIFSNVGALAGLFGKGSIDRVSVSGSIYGEGFAVGGLVGQIDFGSMIANSDAHVQLSSHNTFRFAGGLIGGMAVGSKIEQSYATGDVSATEGAGGLVGEARGSILNSYATGEVRNTGTIGTMSGGLAGLASIGGTVDSYAVGKVDPGAIYEGGLVGRRENFPLFSVTNSYWNASINPALATIGGEPGTDGAVSEADLKKMSTYTGWDPAIWGTQEDVTYPHLKTFIPMVRVEEIAPVYNLCAGGNEIAVSGYVRDGSVGEPLKIRYAIKDAANVTVEDAVYDLDATGDNQAFRWSMLLDGSVYADGTYTLTVEAADSVTGHEQLKIATFVVDSTPPAITLRDGDLLEVERNHAFTDPGATALDARDGDLTADIRVSGVVGTSELGTYTLTYAVTDAAGNTSTKTRTVKVVRSLYPSLLLNGDYNMQIEVGDPFDDPGATSWDETEGDLTDRIVVSGSVDTTRVGTYHILYEVADSTGHGSNTTRTVEVVDTKAPVLALLGADPLELEVGSSFADPGATALDAVDGDQTAEIAVSGTVDATKTGTYTLTYRVSDASGNEATAIRTVKVVDTKAPVLALLGADPLELEVGSPFADPGATALDAGDGDLTADIEASGTVDATKVGSYTLTYRVSDASGNEATATRTVKVVQPPAQPPVQPSAPQLSGNADLASLSLTAAGEPLALSPAFAPGTKSYAAETTGDQVVLVVKPAHPMAAVKLSGERIGETTPVPLTMGANVLTITVQSEAGTVQTYTVTVNRLAPDTTVLPPACAFQDIANHWAKSEICEAAALGIVEGVDAYTFVPDGLVTRTEFAAMLLRALGIDVDRAVQDISGLPFDDRASIPAWARPDVRAAVEVGILDGYTDGMLRPVRTVNRAEMAAMVSKYMKWTNHAAASVPFADDARIPAWAKPYVEAVRAKGIMSGRAGQLFVPDGVTTRAEAAVALLRLWHSIH
ncbi:immunoglobulin-like domain-containing protein [Cohnella sp. GbtcB17]|uniref:immunoglobulin-like domain-containing protein n=1 Tax=Cohnella sp. GbtcB17 TaxID=2824762 RepID=UPI001C3031E3|nr:immunoglobulin-like domain-containing protein [Cohnella sp. GbtcB17]